MKKALLAIALVAGLALLFFAGNTASKNKAPALQNGADAVSALALDETSFDFGSISMKAGKVSRTFTITNPTAQEVVIKKVTTSCMCTEAFIIDGDHRHGPFGMPGHGFVPPVSEVVPGQGSMGLEVVFDPAAHGPAGVGKIERAVFIEDENGGTQVVTIRAFVTP